MRQSQASAALYGAFMAAWPVLYPGMLYVFDNDVADETSPYARVTIQSLPSDQHTLGAPGNRKWLRTGMLIVRLKGPGNVGREQVDLYVEAVRGVFEGARMGVTGADDGVTLMSASASEGPPDGQFWTLAVTIPFDYYETR